MKNEIYSIFPTPLFFSKYFINIDYLIEYIDTIEYNSNGGILQSKNTFILQEEIFSKLKLFFQLKIKEYVDNILGSDQLLDITQSWINVSKTNGYHNMHTHPNSIISGVFYFETHTDTPGITFHKSNLNNFQLSRNKISDYTSDIHTIFPEKGDLILFPSNLLHHVDNNQSSNRRISLSFNTFPKNNLGIKEELTYVSF